MTLTDEGSRNYANSVQILRLVEQAGDETRGNRGVAVETICVSCAAAFGVLHAHRRIERVEMLREVVDIALRLGPPTDSSMKLRVLGESRRLLEAAPCYLERRGTPSPQGLLGHEGIRMSNVAGSDVLSLQEPGGRSHQVPFCRTLPR